MEKKQKKESRHKKLLPPLQKTTVEKKLTRGHFGEKKEKKEFLIPWKSK